MDQQKIDRLFREKMDSLEVMPSADAWAKVEKQIRPKSSFKIYWAAAAVALIFASWLFWPSEAELNQTPIASEVSFPPALASPGFNFNEIMVAEQKEEIALKKKPNVSPQRQLVAHQETLKKEVKPLIEEMLELETKSGVATIEIDQPEIIDELIVEKAVVISSVKITYIASASDTVNEELQKTDSASAFKKFIAFAEKIDPGEVLADFKTAKDNLLNNGFKKRDKNSL